MHIQHEEELERGGKGEREDSLIPLFSPLGIKIVLLFHGCIGFCFEFGILMVKHSLPCLIWMRGDDAIKITREHQCGAGQIPSEGQVRTFHRAGMNYVYLFF